MQTNILTDVNGVSSASRPVDQNKVLDIALEAAGIGTWQYYFADQRWLVCPRAQHLYGIEGPEHVHDEALIHKLMHPDDIARMWENVLKAQRPDGEGKYQVHYRICRPEGGWRWLSVWALVEFRMNDGVKQAVRMIGASRDITAQREAEEALRDSENRYREMVEAQTELLCRFNLDGTILFVNSAYARACGTTPERMMGMQFWQFIPKEEHGRLRSRLATLTPENRRIDIENHFTTTNGTRWFLWTNTALKFDPDGKPTELQSTGRDITDRKQNEALLDAQKTALEMLVVGAPLKEIFTYLTQVTESQTDTPSIAAILLFGKDGLLRHGAAPLLPDAYNNAIDGLKARADLGTCSVAAVTGEIVVTPDIDGDPKWSTIKHLPLDLGLLSAWSQPIRSRNGEVLGTFGTYFKERREPSAHEKRVVAVLARIAALAIEQRNMENMLRDADRRKDEFIATLAHELRNPLAPLLSSLEMIQETDGDPAMVRQLAPVMDRQLLQLVRLVDDLLDLSRISKGKVQLRPQEIDLVEVARDAAMAMQRYFADRGQRLVISLPDRPIRLMADPARLNQVIGNLLNNAGKFTPAKGTIELILKEADGMAVIEVKDDGMGIRQEELDRIFEMFIQSDPAPDMGQSGLGIGLSLVQQLAELHGGGVEAHSEGLGKGSRFTVSIPVKI